MASETCSCASNPAPFGPCAVHNRAEIVVTGIPTQPPPTAEQIHADLLAQDAAVASVYQPLVDRAEVLRRRASDDVAGCRARGQRPRWSPASVQVVADLAELVRDLAKAVAER